MVLPVFMWPNHYVPITGRRAFVAHKNNSWREFLWVVVSSHVCIGSSGKEEGNGEVDEGISGASLRAVLPRARDSAPLDLGVKWSI